VTLADTAVVNVNATPTPIPVATTLHITTPGDSATFSPVLGMDGFTVTALDALDTALTNVNVFCRSSNRNVLDFGRGKIGAVQDTSTSFQPTSFAYLAGLTTMTCSANVYGMSLTDSIPIRINPPLLAKVTVDAQLLVSGSSNVVVSSAVIRIGVGGIVQWDNRSKLAVDLIFDDSLAPQSVPASERVRSSGILGFACQLAAACSLPSSAGNVMLPPNHNRGLSDGVGRDFRRFPVAGTYPYHSTTFPNVAGTIIVSNEIE
jgi:hypothetical protein